MRLNIFRQFLTEGNTSNSPEKETPADATTTKEKESKSKNIITEKNKSLKSPTSIHGDRQKRQKSSKQEVSIYRSKTGSLYATKAPRLHSYDKENDIKREKEKSPQTEQKNIKKRKYINVTSNTTKKAILLEAINAQQDEEDVQDELGWCQIVYYILTLQFLRDLIILAFNNCKKRIELAAEKYCFSPIRKTRKRIQSIIDFIKTWCFQQLDIYLFNPIDYVRNSYIIPFYYHSCNLMQNLYWCATNSKKYCVILFDVLCLRIAKLAENFRHYCAVIFLTKVVPENYTMAYHLFALFRLVLGTLYPAYASYKAVRTKNVREYVSTL